MTLPENYFHITEDSTQPLYLQIQANIIQLIDLELLKPGDALPAERLLSEYYGVNRMTVRQAIESLVQKGLIHKKHGAGTFISEKPALQAFTPTVIGFSQRMREAGINPSSRLLHREVITPEAILAYRLKLGANEPVIMLKRLRLVNDEPLMIETSYLSYAMFSGLMAADLEEESLYRILEAQYGMAIVEAEHTMEPTLPNAFEAHHLGVEQNMPAMLVRVMAYSTDRIPVEFSKSVVRGDRCRYFFRVNTRMPIIQ